MKCFKCGAQMTDGQVICSICDTDNSKKIYDNYKYEPVKLDFSNNYDEIKEKEPDENNIVIKDNKSTFFSVIIIILIFVIIILGLRYLFNYFNNKTEDNNTNDEIFRLYDKIKDDINVKKMIGEKIVCDVDCYEYYDYDEYKFSLIIYDEKEYYKIGLTDNVNEINIELCDKSISCDNNTISGIIYK